MSVTKTLNPTREKLLSKTMKKIPETQIIIYEAENGKTRVEVRFENENVWLTQAQMSELFDRDQSVISKHIKNVFSEGELDEKSNMQILHTAISDKPIVLYSLDVIIFVGYRVKSLRGTQFRIWATERLKEYMIKGFTLDDIRLKQGGRKSRYFEELLQRIRDIRSSERMFYQKVTDIYATSIDYKVNAELTHKFFATVQNKMHYAVHGCTAAEIIANRADSKKPLMGLTSFKSDYITTNDIVIAKNYLTESEINQLNLIVSLYIDFAELQATGGRLMKMQDWIKKLDEFLTISEKRLLHSAGIVSAKQAEDKALQEYDEYRKGQDKNYISDFDREVKKLLETENKLK